MVNSKDDLQSLHLLPVPCLTLLSLSTAQNVTLSPAERLQ